MASYDLKDEQINKTYTFDLVSTPVVEGIAVVRKETKVYSEGNITTTVRFQVNCGSPWYLSVDCESSELDSIIQALQYVKDHPV